MDLCVAVYAVTGRLPADERFVLISQMRRAAVSIPSNIAEGHGRSSRGEYAHFLGISLGSVRELQTQIYLCERLEFISDPSELAKACDDVARLVFSLHRRVRQVE